MLYLYLIVPIFTEEVGSHQATTNLKLRASFSELNISAEFGSCDVPNLAVCELRLLDLSSWLQTLTCLCNTCKRNEIVSVNYFYSLDVSPGTGTGDAVFALTDCCCCCGR